MTVGVTAQVAEARSCKLSSGYHHQHTSVKAIVEIKNCSTKKATYLRRNSLTSYRFFGTERQQPPRLTNNATIRQPPWRRHYRPLPTATLTFSTATSASYPQTHPHPSSATIPWPSANHLWRIWSPNHLLSCDRRRGFMISSVFSDVSIIVDLSDQPASKNNTIMQRRVVVGYEWCDISLLLRLKWHTGNPGTATEEIKDKQSTKPHNNQPYISIFISCEVEGVLCN